MKHAEPRSTVPEATDPLLETTPTTPSRFGILKIGIALLFFLLFAYDVWEVIESALEFSQYLSLQVAHWSILITLMVAPILIWLLAVLIARKLSALKFALILLVGWAVSALVFLNLNYLLQILFLGLL